ncbi:hypothetical protein [Enterococcus sp. AZ196]|uniref:hypothetical protein n=1 Tax=Enterococcus sp. AZ196 TaxID=2774659 RepID=UPI003D278CB6
MSEKLPTIKVIRNTFKKLGRLEDQLTKLMVEKGFEGGFAYRADEDSLCFGWEHENDNKVSPIETQEELDQLLQFDFDEAIAFLEKRSI